MNIIAQIETLGLNAYIAKKHIDKIAKIEQDFDGRIYIELKEGFNNGNDGIVIWSYRSQLRKDLSYIKEGMAQRHREALTGVYEADEFDATINELNEREIQIDADIEARQEIRKEIKQACEQVASLSDDEIEQLLINYEDAQIEFYALGIKYEETGKYEYSYKGVGIYQYQANALVASSIIKKTVNYLIQSKQIIDLVK